MALYRYVLTREYSYMIGCFGDSRRNFCVLREVVSSADFADRLHREGFAMPFKSRLGNSLRALAGKQPKGTTQLPQYHRAFLLRALYFQRRLQSVAGVEGAMIECGVGQGYGLAAWMTLSQLESERRHIWAFDSFEGFPQFSAADQAKDGFAQQYVEYRQFDISYVHRTLLDFGISRAEVDQRVSFAKGFIPDSLALYDKRPIAILHLDLDIYEAYRDAAAFFWDFVAPGGVVMFDEYDRAMDVVKWPGARTAVNEFLDARGLRDALERDPTSGNVFVKKSL